MFRRLAFTTSLGLMMAMAVPGAAAAGFVKAGDLLVVDFGNGTLDDVNPTTGASVVIASGFSNPEGLAVNAQGMIFVSDIGTSTIDEVNPTTGVVTTFSGDGVGTGPALDRPFQMTFYNGTLYVADGGTPNGNTSAVFAIDASGNRTVVASNNGSSNNLFKESVAGLAVDSDGRTYVSSPTGGTIYTVGPGTSTPLTTALSAPQGLAIGANGQLLAINGSPANPEIVSINPTNGDTTVLSNNSGIGTGPAFDILRSLTVGPNGMIYATDVGDDEIYMVDPMNGDRTIVSGGGTGGTTFGGLTYGIAFYPSISSVPEPSSVVMLALGAAGLMLYPALQRATRCIA
jgi:large repetitive protein